MAQRKIMIISGDAFDDLYGGRLAYALRVTLPDVSLVGVGGTIMQQAGVELLYNLTNLENLGGLEVLRASHVVKRLLQRITESMDSLHPQLIIQIGLPVFHFKLIEIAKGKGIPIVYYNSPLNWDLTEVKASQLAKLVNKIIGVSRLETEFCTARGIDATFAGHPLVDIVASKDGLSDINLSDDYPTVAIYPGTNETEVKTYLPTILKAIKRIHVESGPIHAVVAASHLVKRELYNAIIAKSNVVNIQVTDDVFAILRQAKAAVVTSGSASIGAALIKVPALAVHKHPATAYFSNKMLPSKPYCALVNMALQELVMPELIQNDFSETKIASAVNMLLYDDAARNRYVAKLERLADEFGNDGTIDRAAEEIANMLQVG